MNEEWKGHPEAYPADPEPEPEGPEKSPEPPKEDSEITKGWIGTVELLNTLDVKLCVMHGIGKELKQAEQELEAVQARYGEAAMEVAHLRILVNNRLGR